MSYKEERTVLQQNSEKYTVGKNFNHKHLKSLHNLAYEFRMFCAKKKDQHDIKSAQKKR